MKIRRPTFREKTNRSTPAPLPPTRSTRRRGKRGCGACRRSSREDPLVLRSQVSLTVEADNRYYVNSEGSQIVTGDVGCRIFIQGVTKAEDGMELPLYTSYFATSPDGLARRTTARRRSARDGRRCSRGFAQRRSSSRSRARRFSRAAPPACSFTRSSAIASKATGSATRTTGRRSRARWASRCCPRS